MPGWGTEILLSHLAWPNFLKIKFAYLDSILYFIFKMMDFLNKNYWIKEHEHFFVGLHEVSVVAGSFAVAPWPSSCGGCPGAPGLSSCGALA